MVKQNRHDRVGAPAAATLYDVARAAGVSTATVSRVMHGLDRISPSTRQRVLEVIDELGYVPDAAAQSLSRRRKEVIGLVGVERLSPETDIEQFNLLFEDEVLRGVEATLRDMGWSLFISFLQSSEGAYKRLRAMSGKIDGLLIVEGIVSSTELAELAAGLPIVLVAGSPQEQNVDVVDADNRSGTRALVAHLVEVHELRRLFYVSGPAEAPDARERLAAFEEVLAEHRGGTLVGSFEGRFSAASGQAATAKILEIVGKEPVDAVVCANDQMAIGVIRGLTVAGVRVPTDVAVVGFDDIYPGALLAPPLTTVRQPMRMLGERACTLLLERLNDPSLPHRVELLDTELVVRASCGCGSGGGNGRAASGPRRRELASKAGVARQRTARQAASVGSGAGGKKQARS